MSIKEILEIILLIIGLIKEIPQFLSTLYKNWKINIFYGLIIGYVLFVYFNHIKSNHIDELYYKSIISNDTSALYELERLSNQNQSLAKASLAIIYHEGYCNVKVDEYLSTTMGKEVLSWLEYESNIKNNTLAQYRIGRFYANGIGVAQNYTEAGRYYRLAADRGHADALSNLGYYYEVGKGVAQSNTESLKLYGLAAVAKRKTSLFNVNFNIRYNINIY